MTTAASVVVAFRRTGATAVSLLLALALAAVAVRAESPAPADGAKPFPVRVEASPIPTFGRVLGGTRYGDLDYLGGFELTGDSPHFGGLSGIATADSGRDLLMITDGGYWVSARLETGSDGRPVSLGSVVMADMAEAGGRLLIDKRDADSESLAVRQGPDGREAVVGFEARHRILRFPLTGSSLADALTARGRPLESAPGEIRTLRYTKGLEAIAAAPPGSRLAGALVAIAEGPRRDETLGTGWIVGGAAPGRFAYVHSDDFEVTDAAFLPGGDLLVLERRFTILKGAGARIRRVAGRDIVPGARLDGRVVFEAGLAHQIDNMEGLAVDTAPDGSTILTLISDDNHSILQRTLLLRFKLVGGDR